jgi:hypothetical protein
MSEIINRPIVDQLAGNIFDRYSSLETMDESGLSLESSRAIAAASILAYTRGEYNWHQVLDEAMSERGVVTNYSELPVRERHIRCHRAAGMIGELTKSCRSVEDVLQVLNQEIS